MSTYFSYNKRRLCIWAILIVLSIATACSPPVSPPKITVRSCDWLIESDLQALHYGEMATEDGIAWLQDQYGITEVQLEDAYPEGAKRFRWLAHGKEYLAIFFHDRLVRVDVFWNEPLPTGDNVLDCFGQPAFYTATFGQDIEARVLKLGIWYPEQGMNVVTSLYTDSETPPAVDGDIGFRGMSLSKPGNTMEELLDNMVYTDLQQSTVLSSLQTWPNSWEVIEIKNLIVE